MDHSSDDLYQDSKPAASSSQPQQQQQQQQSSTQTTDPGRIAAVHDERLEQTGGGQLQQQRWDASAAAAAAAGTAPQYSAGTQKPRPPLPPGTYSSSSLLTQQQPQHAQIAAATAAAAASVAGYSIESDPYQQRQQQVQQQLLYQQQQQQQQAYATAAGLAPPQQQPQQQPYAAALPQSYFPLPPQPGATGHLTAAAPGGGYLQPQQAAPMVAVPPPPPPPPQQQQQPSSFIQPKAGRLPADRPLIKLSVSLIDTYKNINAVYYEDRDARRAARAKEKKQQGVGGANNNGWDDENYDYIITHGEMFYGRYKIKERIGKGSFGQVVRAEDVESHREVAIKIIKSKKPFLMQAKTEIELLTHLWEKDQEDQHNIVRLLTHFMYRNHQCLVFEMLSLNLYELLKNTQFGGVSLNLIRKFAKQVLKALAFLARTDVDIIHCDLKPENILLRHPKKSGIKVIDFGSSCRSNKRMYSYIQSRFYRSPEVILGLPYTVAIDMWSLGCILAEMHTGEPLFSGSDQFDQMQKIVKLLGMVPDEILDKSSDHIRTQFFQRSRTGKSRWELRQTKPPSSSAKKTEASSSPEEAKEPISPSTDPIASLSEVITAGARQKKKFPPSEAYNSRRNYEMFIDLVYKMLAYKPEERIKPTEALNHPFIVSMEQAGAVSNPVGTVLNR